MRLRGGTDTNNMAGGEPEDEATPGGTVTADERMLQETLNGISELRAESERRISELIAEYYRELKAKVTEIDGAGLGRHPHAVHTRTYIYIYPAASIHYRTHSGCHDFDMFTLYVL